MTARSLILGAAIFVSSCLATLAETSVWKVELNGSVTYLGGTCHVLRQSDFPLPDEFYTAYGDSEVLVLETDLGELKSPRTQSIFMERGFYQDGTSLEKALSPQTYELFSQYCQSVGIPAFSLNRFKPSMAILALLGLELKRLGVDQSGVDEHFYTKARADQKETEWVESVQEQIDFVFAMGEGYEDAFVEYSIRDLKETGETIDRLIEAWRRGDESELSQVFVSEMKTDYPELYKSLLVDRNLQWLPKIETYLQTPRIEFILVGVAHLVGENGIIRDLERRGYRVEKVK